MEPVPPADPVVPPPADPVVDPGPAKGGVPIWTESSSRKVLKVIYGC